MTDTPHEPNEIKKLGEKLSRVDMNRDRGLEKYDQLLGLDIRSMAVASVAAKGSFSWLDLCCGSFQAGQNLIYGVYNYEGPNIASRIHALGVDADTQWPEDDNNFGAITRRANAVTYPIPKDVDLVTCLHGLYYIQQLFGNAEATVLRWFDELPEGALLAFELPENINAERLLSQLSIRSPGNVRPLLGRALFESCNSVQVKKS